MLSMMAIPEASVFDRFPPFSQDGNKNMPQGCGNAGDAVMSG
jgi:hypothetical protein